MVLLLTSEKVVLQTSFGHELVDQKTVLTIQTVSDQLDEILVVELTQVVEFGLRAETNHMNSGQNKQKLSAQSKSFKSDKNLPTTPCGPESSPA